MLNHLPPNVLLVSTDLQGLVTWCSAAVEALVGRPRTALIGHQFPMEVFERSQIEDRAATAGVACGPGLLLLDPSRFERRRNPAMDLGDMDRRKSGPTVSSEIPTGDGDGDSDGNTVDRSCSWNLVGHDGRERIVALTVSKLRGDSGEILGYVAQGLDVTQEHRTNQVLAQAILREQEAARRNAELNRLRDDFVTTASHELRTPLASVLGYVELLEMGIDDPERRTRFADAIRRNVTRLQNLAEGLVILSAPRSERPQPLVSVDLRDVVTAVGSQLSRERESQGVVPEFICPEQPVEVLGDATRLELAVRHLIENALAFTPPGGRITCRVAKSAGEATIEVADTGPGVPPSELPHLFSPFYRGAAAQKEASPGSGLGLCIVAAVVEEHAGRLLVSDSDPHGAVFTVLLPTGV